MVNKKDKNKIIVKKIPLDYFPERHEAYFPTMPILYLELLENKDKVKKDLRLKEYVPPLDRMEPTNIVPTTVQAESQVNNEIDKDFELKEYEEDNTIMKRIGKKNIKILDLTDLPDENKTKENKDIKYEKENKDKYERRDEDDYEQKKEYVIKEDEKTEDEIREEEIKRRLEKRYNKIKDDYVKSRSRDRDERRKDREERREEKYNRYVQDNDERSNSRDRDFKRDERNNSKEERRDERLNSRNYDQRREERNNSRDRDESRDDRREQQDETKNKDEKNPPNIDISEKEKSEDNNDVSKKIIDMFSSDNTSSTQSNQVNQSNNSYQFSQQQNPQQPQKENKFIPPTLSEINNGIVRDNKGVRDVTVGLSKKEDQDDEERRVLYDKFSILKKKYKDYKIPEFSPYADINVLRRTYDSAVKQLQLDYTVENYKKYLIGGFSLTQFLVNKFLKIDMTGFAEQQILSINQYEQVLIEIGEKSYFKAPSQMAPEFKLLMLIGFNVVIFVISKMIFKSTGDNIIGSINKLNEKKDSSSSNNNSAQKPHMRGPSMDDLADLQKTINGNKTKKE